MDEEKISLKAELQHSSSSIYSCVPHLEVELSLWARLLLVVFGIHAHVEFVLAQGATQQGEHQDEPHGSAAGERVRHQIVTSCFCVAVSVSLNTLVSKVSLLVSSTSATML